MSDVIKINSSIINQCRVIKELQEEICSNAIDLTNGFFYKSNNLGFRVASDVLNKNLKEIKSKDFDELNLTWSDLMVIIGGYDNEFMQKNKGYKSKSIKNLADFETSLRSIFDDLRHYDELSDKNN